MTTRTSAAEVREAFAQMVRSLACPACGCTFTDAALAWGDAWSEGRREALRELGVQERDGPYQLKCELCERRSWLNYFAATVSLTDEPQR